MGDMNDIFEIVQVPRTKKKQEWWIDGFLPKETLTLLAAQGGTGKTSLAFYLANEIASRGIVTEDADPIRVACWSFEDDAQQFTNKVGYNEHVIFLNWAKKAPYGERAAELHIEESDIEKMERFFFEHNIHILIVDPISALLDDDGNSNQAVRLVLNKMLKMAREIGITILGIHHFRKDGGQQSLRSSVVGASAWVDTARHVLAVIRNEMGETYVEVVKSNVGPLGAAWEVQTGIDEYGYHALSIERADDFAATNALAGRGSDCPVVQALRDEFPIGQPFNLDDVRACGQTSSFYHWLKKHPLGYQECSKKKDGKKSWIFI